MDGHRKGLLLTGTGVLLISPDAAFIRAIGVPAIDLLFWRGAVLAAVMCLVILVREYRDLGAFLARFTWAVIPAALCTVLMSFLFIVGVTNTSAANALAILAATPLIAAVIGRVFLGERLAWYTWSAAVCVVALIAAIAGDALSLGGGKGVFAAIGASVTLAVYFTIFRASPDTSRLQVLVIGGFAAAVIAATVSTPFDFDQKQMTLTLCLTVLFLPAATILMALGPRYLPAAEVSLLVLLESVFGPLWVFLFLGEIPSPTTIACGAAILSCVAWHAIMASRRRRKLQTAP